MTGDFLDDMAVIARPLWVLEWQSRHRDMRKVADDQ
jgi:hypothetical protein